MENQRRDNSGILILAGIALGAAAAYFLSSEDGKETMRKAGKKAKKMANQAMEAKDNLTADLKEKANKTYNDAVEMVHDLTAKYEETKDELTEKAKDSALTNLELLEQGIAKAKAKLQETKGV